MRNSSKYLLLGLILVITLISYFPVLHNNSFVWDDEGYITSNPVVQSFQLKEIFTANVMGNYHPVTVLVLAVEYFFFGMNASGYHIVNLLLHLLNVLLVFYLVFQLSRKREVALVAALLFGVHPLHVESVAWISGLKDLLYGAFFLGSWIFYLKYLVDYKRKFYFLALLLFLLSLLSKAMAVTLPVVLLLTDFYMGRKMSKTVWFEKIPFFLLSVIFGLLAISAQKTTGNLSLLDFTVPQQFAFASYGFFSYLFKLVLPIKLSAFYPYPVNHPDAFPVLWFGYLAMLIALMILVFYSLRKTKTIFFGFGIFAVTIFLVLQWLPVGKALMADRYSYIPSLALFFLAAEGAYLLWKRNLKWLTIIFLVFFTFHFSLFTFKRCGIWKNEITLWSDVISKYENVPVAFLNRGIAYANADRLKDALDDINRAIESDPGYSRAWFNRGNIHLGINLPEKALEDFSGAIALNPGYAAAFFNRGNTYLDMEKFDLAIADFSMNLRLDPGNAMAYSNRGIAFSRKGDNDQALLDLKKAAGLNPEDPETCFQLGMVYSRRMAYPEAISSFTESLKWRPGDAEAWYYRGLAAFHSGKREDAIRDFNESGRLGYQPAVNFLEVLKGEE